MTTAETPVCFPCGGSSLVGIVHRAAGPARTGVVIVVGGPQYRIGSHRQFVLLARALAAAGVPVLRFDVRGMGDSAGDFPGFEEIDEDIRAAVDAFTAAVPGLDRIVLWGLCDGASASLFYAHSDIRVAGLVLLNPWVRTEASYARTTLKHYYTGKLTDRDFWRRLVTGGVDIGKAARSFWRRLRAATGADHRQTDAATAAPNRINPSLPLPDRMAQGLSAFGGPVLLIMSGKDLTAREFDEIAQGSPVWASLLARDGVTRCDLAAADHTFSRADWTETVNDWTVEWVSALNETNRSERPAPAALNA